MMSMWWWLFYIVVFCVLGLQILLTYYNRQYRLIGKRRTLFVTAHPDDECMFFAPTILSITSFVPDSVHLLCLSDGGYYGEGRLRKQELVKAAFRLGIPPQNVHLIQDKELPDDPTKYWSPAHIMTHVKKVIQKAEINRVVTFDGLGVSGHLNHIADYDFEQCCLKHLL